MLDRLRSPERGTWAEVEVGEANSVERIGTAPGRTTDTGRGDDGVSWLLYLEAMDNLLGGGEAGSGGPSFKTRESAEGCVGEAIMEGGREVLGKAGGVAIGAPSFVLVRGRSLRSGSVWTVSEWTGSGAAAGTTGTGATGAGAGSGRRSGSGDFGAGS